MGANNVFGEVALLTQVPRQADCVAITNVKVRGGKKSNKKNFKV
jgi:CRP-like cAMP-binding protein